MSLQCEVETGRAALCPVGVPTPFIKVCSAPGINANYRRATRTVVRGAHEGAREQALPRKAESGLRQLPIGRRSIIAQQRQKRRRSGRVAKCFREAALGVLYLGPGGVEHVIRQSINAGPELAPRLQRTLVDAQVHAVRED